jgi:PAS domain S-box-containing protein
MKRFLYFKVIYISSQGGCPVITLTEQQRVGVLITLLAISVFLTYYFHTVLMLGTVFSHFFYVPIILTALWWEKRSVPVALFLGGLVVVGTLAFSPDPLVLNDYARVLMFVVVALVVASLSGQLKRREQEVEKERNLAQRYLDVAGGLFVVINADHTIQLVNRHGCELLGYREKELTGRDWFATVVPESSREARRQIFDAAIANGTAFPGPRENPVITRNGEELILTWQDTVLTGDDGRSIGIIGSGSDITGRIRVEGELRAAHEEANLYLDIMVHDINNANAVALGYTDLLTEVLEGKERQMVLKLRNGISRSIEIIQNVSTLRRLVSRETVTRPVDLDAVIRAGIAHHPDAGIVYEGRPVGVMADDLLPEVFANLIGNAEKFGEPGVEVTVRVEEGDGAVKVSVEDTGPGVPDREKPLLFTRFARGTNARSGKGLGLYITKMLISRYGGRIWVDDRVPGHPERGAAFRFTLPRSDQPWEPAVKQAVTPRP